MFKKCVGNYNFGCICIVVLESILQRIILIFRVNTWLFDDILCVLIRQGTLGRCLIKESIPMNAPTTSVYPQS